MYSNGPCTILFVIQLWNPTLPVCYVIWHIVLISKRHSRHSYFSVFSYKFMLKLPKALFKTQSAYNISHHVLEKEKVKTIIYDI